MNLLFVCTGNTCRSPLAEVLGRREAARRGRNDVTCASAGTEAFPGQPAAEAGVAVAAAHGLDLSGHRSTLLDRERVEWADRIVAMTRGHAHMARRLATGAEVVLMADFLPADDAARGRDVPDPIGGGLEVYERTFEVLERAVAGLFDALPPGPAEDPDEPEGS